MSTHGYCCKYLALHSPTRALSSPPPIQNGPLTPSLPTQGPQIYQPKFGPTYRVSYCCSIALLSCTLVSLCTAWYFVRKADLALAREEEAGVGNLALSEVEGAGRAGVKSAVGDDGHVKTQVLKV